MSPSRAADRFASGGAYLTRPSTSSFWAAIAIGAMLKGVPFATVSKVKRNAMAEVCHKPILDGQSRSVHVEHNEVVHGKILRCAHLCRCSHEPLTASNRAP